MMDQTSVGVSPPEGHLQSIYHKLTTQMGCHRPADYSPRVDVEYEGQVEKTLPGIDVGYVRRPDLVRSRCGEVPLQEIRSGCGVKIAAGGSLPTAADTAPQTRLAHQSGNPLARATHSQSLKLGMHPRVAVVGPLAPVVHLPDLLREGRTFLVPL